MPTRLLHRFRAASLSIQISAVTAACVLTLTTVIGIITTNTISNNQFASLQHETEIEARNIIKFAQSFLLFNNYFALEEALLSTFTHEELSVINILSMDGDLITGVRRNAQAAPVPYYSLKRQWLPDSNNLIHDFTAQQYTVWRNFTVHDQSYWLHLVTSTAHIRAARNRLYISTLLVGLLAALATFAVIALFLRPRLNAIRQLTAFSGRLQSQDGRAITLPACAAEITALNHALNLVSQQLHNSYEKMSASELRLRQLVQNMPVMMVAFNEDWDIIVWNRECERITGYAEQEIRLNPSLQRRLFTSEEQQLSFKQLWSQPQDFYHQEFALQNRNGEARVISWCNIARSFPVNGWHSWGIGVDISARIEAEHIARHYLDDLAHASRISTVGELAAGLAHEVSQPLSAIMNYASCASNMLKKQQTEDAGKCLAEISIEATRAGDVIKHLRIFMRKKHPERTTISFGELLQQAKTMLRRQADQHGIRLVFDSGNNGLPLHVDSIQITQVILNLCINAIDALQKVPAERRFIYLSSETSSTNHFVTIADTGPGLENTQIKDIFTPFFSTKELGLGLGLSISTSIIESHGGELHANQGGKIAVDGVLYDVGCSFTFSLPLAESERHAAARHSR